MYIQLYFFPTCQVRVSRFYQSCMPPTSAFTSSSSTSVASTSSTASSRSQWALPGLNRERKSSVGTAGPQPRALDLSGHCRTSPRALNGIHIYIYICMYVRMYTYDKMPNRLPDRMPMEWQNRYARKYARKNWNYILHAWICARSKISSWGSLEKHFFFAWYIHISPGLVRWITGWYRGTKFCQVQHLRNANLLLLGLVSEPWIAGQVTWDLSNKFRDLTWSTTLSIFHTSVD